MSSTSYPPVVETPAGYTVSDDPARVDLDAVWGWLSTQAYWGRWRGRDEVAAQVAGAWRVVCAFGPDGGQVGFARAVSDGVVLAYLADVYVDAEHRGVGVAQAMLALMVDHGPGADFRWMLHTADAHPLYARFGFRSPDASYLERPARGGKAHRLSVEEGGEHR